MADEQIVSWRAIVANIPVVASDGKEVGKVLDVAALPEEDIFHGVVYKSQQDGHTVLAPRDDIDRITPDAVHLSVDSEQSRSYEPFREMHVEKLGLKGLFFWKHTGWKDSSE
jgi:sporulation protein YlmC with PRC-barrel domain